MPQVGLDRHAEKKNGHAESDFAEVLQREDPPMLSMIANRDNEVGPASHVRRLFQLFCQF